MVKEFIDLIKEIIMLDTGEMEKLKGKFRFFMKMGTHTKVNSTKKWNDKFISLIC